MFFYECNNEGIKIESLIEKKKRIIKNNKWLVFLDFLTYICTKLRSDDILVCL
jgi:hypothetical protein